MDKECFVWYISVSSRDRDRSHMDPLDHMRHKFLGIARKNVNTFSLLLARNLVSSSNG